MPGSRRMPVGRGLQTPAALQQTAIIVLMKLRLPALAAVTIALAVASPHLTFEIVHSSQQSAADLRTTALDLAYNLDHDQALAVLHRAILEAPDDPAPHRSLAAVLWLNILF